MRRGFDPKTGETAVEVAKAAEAGGAAMVTVHGRYRTDFYTGNADRQIVKKVKENIEIPVILSGDIVDRASALSAFEETGCDGIMIGRGALGDPWIFREILADEDYTPAKEEFLDTIRRQCSMLTAQKGENTAVREMRKHLSWYFKGMRGASQLKKEAFAANTLADIDALLAKI